MLFSCLPTQDDKVCVISVIGKSRYEKHSSKATVINSVIDSNAFLVNVVTVYVVFGRQVLSCMQLLCFFAYYCDAFFVILHIFANTYLPASVCCFYTILSEI